MPMGSSGSEPKMGWTVLTGMALRIFIMGTPGPSKITVWNYWFPIRRETYGAPRRMGFFVLIPGLSMQRFSNPLEIYFTLLMSMSIQRNYPGLLPIGVY